MKGQGEGTPLMTTRTSESNDALMPRDFHCAGDFWHLSMLVVTFSLSLVGLVSNGWADLIAVTYVCELHVDIGLFSYSLECGDFLKQKGPVDCTAYSVPSTDCHRLNVLRAIAIIATTFAALALVGKIAQILDSMFSPAVPRRTQTFNTIGSLTILSSGIFGVAAMGLWAVLLEKLYKRARKQPFLPEITSHSIKSATMGWGAACFAVAAVAALVVGFSAVRMRYRAERTQRITVQRTQRQQNMPYQSLEMRV